MRPLMVALPLVVSIVASAAADDVVIPPAFTRLGASGTSFGSAALPRLPGKPVTPQGTAPFSPEAASFKTNRAFAMPAGSRARSRDEDDDDDEDVPSKPGRLSTSFAKVPGPAPFLRNRSLGPHLVPDAQFDLNDKTSLGVITPATSDGKTKLPLGTLATPAPFSPVGRSTASHAIQKSKDLGFGLSLEYRFGH